MNTSWSNNDENNINLSSLHEQIPNFGWLSPIIAPIGTHISDGKSFFFNSKTGESSWVKPDALKTPEEVSTMSRNV
jgi:hypothetical protein